MSADQTWPQADPGESEEAEKARRGAFTSRRVFIFAAIGSAVGLGNIWRFPYVAYDNGGGAFIIPYLVALLTAGIPFLWFDYALGHKFRGSAPLSFARLKEKFEFIGWWQVLICFVISVYYAAVLAWALSYTFFSVNKSWGSDTESFFIGEYLKVGEAGVQISVVWSVLVPLLVVWVGIGLILLLGVQRGVGLSSLIFIPLLVLAFLILVIRAITLPGAAEGLNTLFTPNWGALAHPGVWAAAFGQIFFSLSIGFGIMITYSSYVNRNTDMTGSGMVVGFANSSFEVLAGIGVFAALGFMAQASGVAVTEVVTAGVGLAFIAFPAIINEAPGGALLGVLFFFSLVVAGITSLISLIEVVISAVRDKFEMSRKAATGAVLVPMTVVSLVFFSTTSGLHVLDIVDHFVNRFGILLVAVVSLFMVGWGASALQRLADHMNRTGNVTLGQLWIVLLQFVVPVILSLVLLQELWAVIKEPYGGYPQWMLIVFGWLMAISLPIFGWIASQVSWRPDTSLAEPQYKTEEVS
ncbi:MAG TPA: sodium-dependent transporter [Intrasporangiaceae bacterium]|nr:sodium-dependent transporter [Intrasporangiaceae bacterium]